VRLKKTITEANRAEIVGAVQSCAVGSQIDLVDDPRSREQNRLMWWLLTDIAQQRSIGGAMHPPEHWKCAFMKAIGVKLEFLPSIDGRGVVAVGYSSARLSKEKMSEMITLMYQKGDEWGVHFRIDERKGAA
jgi:hypothetical protein